MSISFAIQLHLQCFLKTTELLALDLSVHTLCCFLSEELIPSDKTRRRKSYWQGYWQIFTLLFIELTHFLESKTWFSTL
jgi:hypothetical protein